MIKQRDGCIERDGIWNLVKQLADGVLRSASSIVHDEYAVRPGSGARSTTIHVQSAALDNARLARRVNFRDDRRRAILPERVHYETIQTGRNGTRY